MGLGLKLDTRRTLARTEPNKTEVCQSPIGKMIASLEARVLHSPGGTSPPGKPFSPGLMSRVDKVLADGGADLGEFFAGDFTQLSWLLRMEVFERAGSVTGTLRHLSVSCRALYESVRRGVSKGMLKVGGRRAQLWRCLKSQEEGGNVWADWIAALEHSQTTDAAHQCDSRFGELVQHGKSELAHLLPSSAYARSRTAHELLVGCCIHADRPDFMKVLISRGSPFWDAALCSACSSAREWCRCPESTRGVGITPLALCCIHNHARTAAVLLEAGASLTAATTMLSAPHKPLQPIHLCCTHGAVRTAAIMCTFQPRVASMATQADMLTPLMLAVQQNNLPLCEALLAYQYTAITARDASGLSVSDHLSENHTDEFVQLLSDAGALPNALIEKRLVKRQNELKARKLQAKALASMELATPRGRVPMNVSNRSLSDGLLLTPRTLNTPRSGHLTSRLLLPPVRSMSSGSLGDVMPKGVAEMRSELLEAMDKVDSLTAEAHPADVSSYNSLSTLQDSHNDIDGCCSTSRSNTTTGSWESSDVSSSDEPLSRAQMKAASSVIVNRGVEVPKLDFGLVETPRSVQKSCGLPANFKLMAGNQRSVQAFNRALQRSARLRACMEDSESEESSAATSPIDGVGSARSSESSSSTLCSDFERTPDEAAKTVPIPSLDLTKMGMKLGTAMAPVQHYSAMSSRSKTNLLGGANVAKQQPSKPTSPGLDDFDDLLGELDMAF